MTKSNKLSGGLVVGAEEGLIFAPACVTADREARRAWEDVIASAEVTAVTGERVRSVLQKVMGDAVTVAMIPSSTRLRAKGLGAATALHIDYDNCHSESTMMQDWSAPTSTPPASASAASSSSSPSSRSGECCGRRVNLSDETGVKCGRCRLLFHIGCCHPNLSAVPDGVWHCPRCCNLPLPFHTCWVSLGQLTAADKDGRLAVIPGSHRLGGHDAPVQVGDDLLPGGFTPEYRKAAVWHVAEQVGLGDAIVFNMKLVHAATRNNSGKYRLSVDTRFSTFESAAAPPRSADASPIY